MDRPYFESNLNPDRFNQTSDRRIELKFLLSKTVSSQVRSWADERMHADPHCTSTTGDSYEIHTLYLDTGNLDLYYNTGVIGTTKHRLRRYGNEEKIWIETKRKKKDVVQKQRTLITPQDLNLLSHPHSGNPAWIGAWFQRRVMERDLHPATLVHYQRYARIAAHQGRTIRLTIDNQLAGRRYCLWEVPGRLATLNELSPDLEILELKFYETLPPLFKHLLLEFPILATGFSKYRTAVADTAFQADQHISQ